MSQVIHISDELYQKLAEQAQQQGQPVDAFVEERLAAAVEPLPDSEDDEDEGEYDASTDPLAPFIGAFEFDEDPGWMERHDEYFAGGSERDELRGDAAPRHNRRADH